MQIAVWKSNDKHTGVAICYEHEEDLKTRLYNQAVIEWPDFIIDTVSLYKYRVLLDRDRKIVFEEF